ncbi:hypothetical protein VTJ49DRAFT_4927 [Mycothermus thermophilus]|uniref:White collar 1 protein n=1 Tax=Humicola insolens TaxID=85995 RepID=A0ABR3VR92_HUMIN
MQARDGAGMTSDRLGGGQLAGQKRSNDDDDNANPAFASRGPLPQALDHGMSLMEYDPSPPGNSLFQGFAFSFSAPGGDSAMSGTISTSAPFQHSEPSTLMPVPSSQTDYNGNLMVSPHGMAPNAFTGLFEGGMLGTDPAAAAAAASMGFFGDPQPPPPPPGMEQTHYASIAPSDFAVDPLDLSSVETSPLDPPPPTLGTGMPGFAVVSGGTAGDLMVPPINAFGAPAAAVGHGGAASAGMDTFSPPPEMLRSSRRESVPASFHSPQRSINPPRPPGSDRRTSITSAPSPMAPPPLPRAPPGGAGASGPPRPGKKGIYSKSGFDMIRALTYVATRKNPTIEIGAVDLSCSFLVCDLTLNDCPIVYVSDNFQNLTGYNRYEIMGKNCRFLQSPDGYVEAGSRREFVANDAVYDIKKAVTDGREIQRSLINYRKGGKPFLNLLTLIPIPWDDSNGEFRYCVGFQIDLVECPEAITSMPPYESSTTSSSSSSASPAATSPANSSTISGAMRVDYRHGEAIASPLRWTPPPSTRWDPDLAGTGGKTLSAAEVSSLLQHQINTTALQHSSGGGAAGAGGNMSALAPSSASAEWHRQAWDKMLLENADDVVHVLSLKGLFLYLSPACKNVLEYDPAELVGNPLASVCHPSDIVPVTRELRDAAGAGGGGVVNVAFRVRRKNSGPVLSLRRALVDAHSNNSSIITNSPKPNTLPNPSNSPSATSTSLSIASTTTTTTTTLWTKLSTSGLILFASPSGTRAILDLPPHNLEGTSIQALLPSNKREMRAEFGRAVEKARQGRVVGVRHEVVNRAGKVVAVETVFYPGDGEVLTEKEGVAEGAGEAGRGEEGGKTGGRTRLVGGRQGAKAAAAVGQESGQDKTSDKENIFVRGFGGDGDDGDDLFAELKTTRCTSWQYELRQMEKDNRRLADELAQLVVGKKRKRRKGSGGSAGSGSNSGGAGATARRGSVGGGSAAAAGGTAGANLPPPPPPPAPVKGCANCHKKETPEWRRGPSGNRDLCNSCGLRWAKQTGKLSPRNTSRTNSNASNTSSASDGSSAASKRTSVSTTSSNSHSPAESSPLRRELPSSSAFDAVGVGGVGACAVVVGSLNGSGSGSNIMPGMGPIREE